MMKVFYGGVWKDIAGANVFANGAWRSLSAIKAYVSGAWRDVANFTPPGGVGGGGGGGSLSLSVSPASTFRHANNTVLTSPSITCTPSGGLAPYTYVWSFVSQDGFATYTINSPTLATCSVTASGCPEDQTVGCVIHCSVTDSLAVHATTDNVPTNFENFSLS